MLPQQNGEDFKGHSGGAHAATLYLRRMLRFRHMDIDHTLWLMLNLCVTRVGLARSMAVYGWIDESALAVGRPKCHTVTISVRTYH